MRRIAATSLFLIGSSAFAQFPPANPIPGSEPGRLPKLQTPPANSPGVTISNGPIKQQEGMPTPRPTIALVRAEKATTLGVVDIVQQNGNWQVMAGKVVFANAGQDWKTAEKIGNTIRTLQFGEMQGNSVSSRDLAQTAWATIGESRPVVGYLIVKGEPARVAKGLSNPALSIDLNTVKSEQVRGVWVVRDYRSILLNFGPDQQEAEQAVAAILKYGFNRIGYIGTPDSASLRYFFADVDDPRLPRAPAPNVMQQTVQELALDRTGVDIPGVGTVGQKVNLDARKMTVRKDGADFVIAHGTDVLSKFGRDEWSARDALRIIQQMNPTAIVRIGSPGITFFLNGSEAPNRLPFGTNGAPFEYERLTTRQTADGVYHLYEQNGRDLAQAKTKEDMEAIRVAIKHFKLNRTCAIGNTPATALNFLGRTN